MLNIGRSPLFPNHIVHGFLPVDAILLRGNSVGQIHFLNLSRLLLTFDIGDIVFAILLSFLVHFYILGDFRLNLHQDDLLAIRGQPIILLTEAQKGGSIGLLHLREI